MSKAKKYLDSAKIKYDRGDYTGAIADLDKAISKLCTTKQNRQACL